MKKVGGVIVRDHEILVVHRVKHGDEYFILPAGEADDSETDLKEAARREIRNICGIEPQVGQLLFSIKFPHEQYFFLIEKFEGEPELYDQTTIRRNAEQSNLVWISPQRLLTLSLYPEEVKQSLVKLFYPEN